MLACLEDRLLKVLSQVWLEAKLLLKEHLLVCKEVRLNLHKSHSETRLRHAKALSQTRLNRLKELSQTSLNHHKALSQQRVVVALVEMHQSKLHHKHLVEMLNLAASTAKQATSWLHPLQALDSSTDKMLHLNQLRLEVAVVSAVECKWVAD